MLSRDMFWRKKGFDNRQNMVLPVYVNPATYQF